MSFVKSRWVYRILVASALQLNHGNTHSKRFLSENNIVGIVLELYLNFCKKNTYFWLNSNLLGPNFKMIDVNGFEIADLQTTTTKQFQNLI